MEDVKTLEKLDHIEAMLKEVLSRKTLRDTIFIEDAMELTGLTREAIYMRKKRKEIPCWKHPPTGRLQFSRKELLAWLEQGKE